MSEEFVGVEEQEVAEPADTGVEEQEVAEPADEKEVTTKEEESRDYERDAAFAEMRRAQQEAETARAKAESELARLKAEQEARNNVIAQIADEEDADIKALAEAYGIDPDEINASILAEMESAQKDLRIEELESQLQESEISQMMKDDLAAIQKIDPNVKSLDDLGDGFREYISAGLSAEKAYWAIKSEEQATSMKPPKSMGSVKQDKAEKSFFTPEEVRAMTPEEQANNSEKIIASMEHWQ